MAYQPPIVMSFRDPLTGTLVETGRKLRVAVIGKSGGKRNLIEGEEITKGLSGINDTLANSNVKSILRISDTLKGLADYRQEIDYSLDGDEVRWYDTALLAVPVLNSATGSATGGVLAANTYYYVICALNANGDTLVSNEVSVTVMGTTSSIKLDWNIVAGASGYKIWRTLIAGDYTTVPEHLLATVAGGSVSSFKDDGSIDPLTALPLPIANTAVRNPKTGEKYYIDYYYNAFSHNTPVRYFSTSIAYRDHGINSPLGLAARLVLAKPPEGNGASSIYLVSVENDTQSEYIAALETLKPKELDVIVSLLPIDDTLLAHVTEMSSYLYKKRRIFITGAKKGTLIGDETIEGTMIYDASSLKNKRAIFVAPSSVFINVPQEDNTYVKTEVDGSYLAVAVAGRLASLPDVAEPLTRKRVYGIEEIGLNPETSQEYLDSEKDLMAEAGLCIVNEEKGVTLVRHGITTDVAKVEDQEISIVLAEDEIISSLEERYKDFLGQKLNAEILDTIVSVTKGVLDIKLREAILSSYDPGKITAEQDPDRPTWVLVSFWYTPMYPVNVIKVTYGFSLLS